MLCFDNFIQNTDNVSQMCQLLETPHSIIFLPNLATELHCNMLQYSSVTRIQTKLAVHIIRMKAQVLKSYYINPSAWGHLNPSSYCDVGRFFYRVFKF